MASEEGLLDGNAGAEGAGGEIMIPEAAGEKQTVQMISALQGLFAICTLICVGFLLIDGEQVQGQSSACLVSSSVLFSYCASSMCGVVVGFGNIGVAIAPLPAPYSASFPTYVLFIAAIGLMGSVTEDRFLMRIYTYASLLCIVLSLLYFSSLCIWVHQVNLISSLLVYQLPMKVISHHLRDTSCDILNLLQSCTAGTCSASGVSCYSNSDCKWNECKDSTISLPCAQVSTGTCTESGKRCSNIQGRDCSNNAQCTVNRIHDSCYLKKCVAGGGNCDVTADCDGGTGYYPNYNTDVNPADDCSSSMIAHVKLCHGSGKRCTASYDCLNTDTCQGGPSAAVANSDHFCPSLRGAISMHFFMFLIMVVATIVGNAHAATMSGGAHDT